MKRTLTILLIFAMLLSMPVVFPVTTGAADNSSNPAPQGEPISTAGEFAAMKENKVYYLAENITLSASYKGNFRGILDGNYKTITTNVPVFELLNGTVKNLTIEYNGAENKMEITTFPLGAPEAFGGLAYRAATNRRTEVINVTNKINMSSTKHCMGGLLGYAGPYKLVLKGCVNNGAITGTTYKGNHDSGGMLATYSGQCSTEECLEVIDCVNNGNISTYGRPGGIIGYCVTSAKFVKCTNTGSVTAFDNYGGGICGRLCNTAEADEEYLFEDCVNNGDIAIFKSNGGGLCGYAQQLKKLKFKNCVNTGNVDGIRDKDQKATGNTTDQMYLAGIICLRRFNKDDTADKKTELESIIIEDCFNFGKIGDNRTGTTDNPQYNYNRCAGIITDIALTTTGKAKLSGCVNYGDVYINTTSSQTHCAGGIVAVCCGQTYGQICIDRCGNVGNVISTRTTKVTGAAGVAGIAGYCWAASKKGPQITNCFNTGTIKGPTLAAGVVGYMNSKNDGAKIENCYVAGTIKSTAAAKPKSTGDKVGFRELYSYTGSNNVTRYFLSPSPKNYANATVTISGDTLTYKKDTNDTEKAVPTFDHGNLLAVALAWSNQGKYTNSNNIIAKGCAGIDYAMGDNKEYSVLGGISDESRSSGPEATAFTGGNVTGGNVIEQLNSHAANAFYQNSDTSVPVVNTYPTTDRLHITVSLGTGDTVEWQDVDGNHIEGETNAQYKGKAPCENFCHWNVTKDGNKVTCKAVKHVGEGEWSAYDETTHTRERQCTKCGGKEKLEFADIVAYNISLRGDIVVNFHAELPASWIDKEDTGYVRYTYKGVTSDPVPVTAYSLGAVLSYPVVAKEMTENVKVELLVKVPGNPEEYVTGGSETKCVRDYGQTIVNDKNFSPATRKLTAALLNYGAAAQTYFGHKTDELANTGLTYDGITDPASVDIGIGDFGEGDTKAGIVTQGTVDGIVFKSAALNLKTTTSVRFYFALTSGVIGDYTFKYKIKGGAASDEKPLDSIQRGDKWMVEIPNIYAANLDRKYMLTVSKSGTDMTIEYSPFLYFNRMWDHMDENQNPKERPLGKAMYSYFKQIGEYGKINSFDNYTVDKVDESNHVIKNLTKGNIFTGQFNVMQGGCTDGTNLYYAIQKQATNKDTDVIFKYTTSDNGATWTQNMSSEELQLDHCNDLCYCGGKIYAVRSSVYGETRDDKTFLNTAAEVDPGTLTIIEGRENISLTGHNFGNLSYNAYRDCFVAGSGSKLYIMKLNEGSAAFELKSTIEGFNAGYTNQGNCCDDEYIYAVQWAGKDHEDLQDHILVYDWQGNYINKIMLPARNINSNKEPENMSIIGDYVYLGYHSDKGGQVYRCQIVKNNQ